MTTQIYTLSDPDTNQVRYVGKANNPKKRYYKHYVINKNKTHKNNWINKLIKENKKPILDIIDVVSINEWVFWESYWINQMKVWGFDLVNSTYGGEGSTNGNSTSFKKGQGGKKIICLTKSGEYVKTYNSQLEAEETIKKVGIDSVLKGKTKTCGGYIWLYETDYSLIKDTTLKKIVKIANTLKKFDSETRFNKGQEPWNKGKVGYKLGGLKKAKEVQQLDFNGNILNEFISISEAAKLVNMCEESIRRCCVGKKESTGGFKYKYKYK